METFVKEIDKILEGKNDEIYLLKWQIEKLTDEIKELKREIEMYRENEVNRA